MHHAHTFGSEIIKPLPNRSPGSWGWLTGCFSGPAARHQNSLKIFFRLRCFVFPKVYAAPGLRADRSHAERTAISVWTAVWSAAWSHLRNQSAVRAGAPCRAGLAEAPPIRWTGFGGGARQTAAN